MYYGVCTKLSTSTVSSPVTLLWVLDVVALGLTWVLGGLSDVYDTERDWNEVKRGESWFTSILPKARNRIPGAQQRLEEQATKHTRPGQFARMSEQGSGLSLLPAITQLVGKIVHFPFFHFRR
jgi:hypothetical protein